MFSGSFVPPTLTGIIWWHPYFLGLMCNFFKICIALCWLRISLVSKIERLLTTTNSAYLEISFIVPSPSFLFHCLSLKSCRISFKNFTASCSVLKVLPSFLRAWSLGLSQYALEHISPLLVINQ